MACAVEVAEPVRTITTPKLGLSELRDLLDSLESQGADEQLLEQIAQAYLTRIGRS
jgi:hypothetical protein